MLSFLKSIFSYFASETDEDNDYEKENFLAEQLVDLESSNAHNYEQEDSTVIPRDALCYQRTGNKKIFFNGLCLVFLNYLITYSFLKWMLITNTHLNWKF